MKQIQTIIINGVRYDIYDPSAARVDDVAVSAESTWSSDKINTLLGDVESALDSVLAIQEELTGGESV